MKRTVRVKDYYRHTSRGRVHVSSHQKNVTIAPRARRLLTEASRPHYSKEFGGVMDFDKKGDLERFTTEIGGQSREIELPDYEVLWHTHPDEAPNPASPEDVVALLKNKNQQAEIVVNNGRVFTVVKTPATKKLSGLSDEALTRRFEKEFYKSASKGPKHFFDSYANSLRREGFVVLTKKDDGTPVSVPIKVVE